MEETKEIIRFDSKAQTRDERQSKNQKQKMANHARNGELLYYGVRGMMMTPLAMCEKLDRMFGSGSEAIVHYMQFESGRCTFDTMVENNPTKSREEVLRLLVELQPSMGWGCVSLTILHTKPPTADIVVRNPPVKCLKGSQKQIIGSFWAGVLSRYFNEQLVSKNFGYDAQKDEFRCTSTV